MLYGWVALLHCADTFCRVESILFSFTICVINAECSVLLLVVDICAGLPILNF